MKYKGKTKLYAQTVYGYYFKCEDKHYIINEDVDLLFDPVSEESHIFDFEEIEESTLEEIEKEN